jgi:hypothetical protein
MGELSAILFKGIFFLFFSQKPTRSWTHQLNLLSPDTIMLVNLNALFYSGKEVFHFNTFNVWVNTNLTYGNAERPDGYSLGFLK